MDQIGQKLIYSMTKVRILQPSASNLAELVLILGLTALHLAVLSGQVPMVKMLLAYGAKPDVQDARSGKTGLFLTIELGYQSIVELLLSYGGSASIASYSGVTPASLGTENRKIMANMIQNI